MKTLGVMIRLAPVDLKNLRRDSLLMWIPVVPFLLALLMRWGIPLLTEMVRLQAGRDLEPWYPLIMSSFVITVAGLVGMVVGFLLLDERDAGVLDALLVTPVSAGALVAYRVAVPLAVGFFITLLTYPLVGMTPLPLVDLAAATALGSFAAPFMALYLAAFADNKVTGFAMVKLMNAVQILPLAAFFVEQPAQLAFGLIPTYWPMKIIWLAAEGQPYGPYLVAGLVVNVAAVGLLLRRFDRVVHR